VQTRTLDLPKRSFLNGITEDTIKEVTQPQPDLMQQIRISIDEVERRLHLFNITSEDRLLTQNFAGIIHVHLDEIIDTFYEFQLENPEIAAIIGRPKRLARLKSAMARFLTTLFDAKFDEAYINGRLQIGKVHKELSITPKLYMSAMVTLQSVLDLYVESHCPDDMDRQRVKVAVHKCLLFDSQLVFDAYIHGYQKEMQEARAEVGRYASHLEIKVETLTRELYEQMIRDTLTGLYIRQAFLQFLDRELAVAKRFNLPVCLVYFDLNGFKKVNDTYGHEAGDEVLRQVGDSLTAIVRTVDIECRYGGDEFCIIMPRCDLDGVTGPLNRLTQRFDEKCGHDVTFSIGVVQVGPEDFLEAKDILAEADRLMYQAKEQARKKPGHYVRS